jgi:hypothetical protein
MRAGALDTSNPMPSPCIFCESPRRSELEQKIAAKIISQTEAGKILGCHHASISRHVNNHLRRGVNEAVILPPVEGVTRDISRGLNVAKQLERSHDDCIYLFKEALRRGNIRDALRALEVEIKQLQLSAKLQGVYADTPQINLLMQPEFIQLKKVVVEGLKAYPEKLPEISAKFDAMVDGVNKGQTTIKREINEIIEVELSDNAAQE